MVKYKKFVDPKVQVIVTGTVDVIRTSDGTGRIPANTTGQNPNSVNIPNGWN